MIMKKSKILIFVFLLSCITSAYADSLKGYVFSTDKSPVADAVISYNGKTYSTDENGFFTVDNVQSDGLIKVQATGYYSQSILLKGRTEISIYLIENDRYKYNETAVLPFRLETEAINEVLVDNLNKKDFMMGGMTVDRTLQGEIPGLQVTNKSGMTGEGAYMSIHGLRSLVADNAPLIVINGVPYLPNKNESQMISGYSRSIFQAYNVNDIQNITVLKGADASLYGSLGANGVILIETDGATSDDMNTKITFTGQFGTNWNSSNLPLMNSSEYKSYLSDMGMTYYDNMETFFNEFPFLTDPNNKYNYLYQFDTDWQDELYNHSMVNDYLLRVEGGDAIAKYDISLGYMRDEGTIANTFSSRYNAQINTNVLVSKTFDITTTLGLAYLDGEYQEQGMSLETNPMLAAYRKSPLLSPFKSDMYGDLLDTYSSYNFGNSTNTDFIVSNPVSIVNTLTAGIRQYDVSAKVQLSYKPTQELAFSGIFGLYYNYDQESIFIPGINNSDIVPLFDQYGEAENTVRVGVAETFDLFFNLNASYKKLINNTHGINLMAGGQMLITRDEYDAGSGRNSSNDFYQTLGDVNSVGRYFFGYNNKWNWMSYYLHGDYTYKDLVKASVNVSTDAASSTGDDATRWGIFPSGGLTFMAKSLLEDVSFINKLNLKADYGLTGNSRFSSKYGQYYYTSHPYQGISGIVRANVPNTNLKWEKDLQFTAGLEASLFQNRVDLSVGYYHTKATDVLMISPNSSVYGTGYYYCNDAAIKSSGWELALQLSPIYTKDFKWVLGGNITTLKNEVTSLGSVDQTLLTLSDDATIITKVGENPYSFYGYQTAGVFSTTSEANAANLKNKNGIAYEAGDVHFVDQNNDNVINDDDKVILGSATPKYYGSIFNRFEYKGFALDVTFVYSIGNDAYNAVRRITESSSDFSNQSEAVNRRWTMEGQVTDMPRANWADVVGNNTFSDRWIEDASYLKLRDITLSYSFNKPLWKFFRSGTIYVTGQNLWCVTNYLGMDPEFSYSYNDYMQGVDYAKATMPKTVKIGVNLKF